MPFVPDATINTPDIEPPASVHTELVTNPLGLDVIVQPMSADAKLVPVRMTLVPARPEVGNIVIDALVVKVRRCIVEVRRAGRGRNPSPLLAETQLPHSPHRYPI